MTTLSFQSVEPAPGVLGQIISEETFYPQAPETREDVGLPVSMLESLVLKYLAVVGVSSGRNIADQLCLPWAALQDLYSSLRTRQLVVHDGAAALNDYRYKLTEQGRDRARNYQRSCSYVGPAPVTLEDYLVSVEAQSIRGESPKRAHLEKAFSKVSVETRLFDMLGPAINSGAGLFLYGAPGNGKSTLARCITSCFGQHIWVPYAVVDDGQIIMLYDPTYHVPVRSTEGGGKEQDRRWLRIRRPTVIVGGELTMDALEIRHNDQSHVCEAPIQLKSNCGCLLIDDFGRQRVEPAELLNRWIIPLESRYDFLTLPTGKKIRVPFEQLIIFSTNLEPEHLVDEAFLRRIPYKIKVEDPGEAEYHRIFELYCEILRVPYRRDVVQYLIDKHYVQANRPLRRCHPRDLLGQVRNYCTYHEQPFGMSPDLFDLAVQSYFPSIVAKPLTPSSHTS